jgi:hypothetical protein
MFGKDRLDKTTPKRTKKCLLGSAYTFHVGYWSRKEGIL